MLQPFTQIRAVFLGTLLAIVLAAAPTSNTRAEPINLAVDLSHTSVHWFISHGGFTQVIGTFREINEVEIVFDPDDVSNSRVRVVVNSASLDSRHYFRDNFTRSDTFLNVKEHPTITFESTSIEKTGENTGTMTGNLTLRGETREVTFNVTYNKGGPHFRESYIIHGFTARTTIKRSDFGMDAFLPWVGDEIEILIQTEGHSPGESSE